MIPDLNRKSTRDLIISALGAEWPMSVRKIHKKVRMHTSVSYHAIYKTVKQLVAEGILQKKDKEYLINKSWIEQMINFFEQLATIYSRKSSNEPNILFFNTVAEADNYLMSLPPENDQKKIVQCRHLWWALFRPETAYARNQKDKIYRNETYVICNGNTVVDKWCARFEENIGKHIKLGVECVKNCDVFVYGSTVLEVYYPERLLKIIDCAYERVRRIEELNLKNLIKNFYKKSDEIIIVANRNEKVAERIKRETLSHFS
jgi:hypothetical protein